MKTKSVRRYLGYALSISLLFALLGVSQAQADLGGSWLLNYDAPSPVDYIDSLAVYHGKLYAGTCCNSAIYVYDGTTWTLNFVADNGHWSCSLLRLSITTSYMQVPIITLLTLATVVAFGL